jgi:hypothetical protein
VTCAARLTLYTICSFNCTSLELSFSRSSASRSASCSDVSCRRPLREAFSAYGSPTTQQQQQQQNGNKFEGSARNVLHTRVQQYAAWTAAKVYTYH